MIEQVCNGSISYVSLEGDSLKQVKAFLKIRPHHLSDCGKKLKASLIAVQDFYNKMKVDSKSNWITSSNFIKTSFGPFFEKHGESFKKTLIFGLLENVIARMEGHTNHQLGEHVMNFFMMIDCVSPHASRIASANLCGPHARTVERHNKKVEIDLGTTPIIHRSPEEAVKVIVDHHKNSFKINDVVAFSVSIDATKVAPMVQTNQRYRALVGGAAPNHFIRLPVDVDDNAVTDFIACELENFNGIEPTKKKAAEVKLATLSYQWTHDGQSPYLQVSGRPQTKKQKSQFNFDIVNIFAKAETELREDGYAVSFVSAANDGVSCDSVFVITILKKFLKGLTSLSAHTDTNHNEKNNRYQMIIGGNSVKTIGNVVIDSPKAGVPSMLWRVKDFSSDLLVLQLLSSETVASILSVVNLEPDSAIALCVSLYFNRVHLYSVNCKGGITSKARVFMLWSSLLYKLHVDGIHDTSKRNNIVEVISMVFLMLRDNVIRPDRLTSEPSEHSIAHMRGIIREFTVNELISIVNKIGRLWTAMFHSNLSCVRSQNSAGGYTATIDSGTGDSSKNVNLPSGHVKIEHNPSKLDTLKAMEDDWSVAKCLWSELMPILNSANDTMRKFLTNVFKVKEFHPFIESFNNSISPSELLTRLELTLQHSDSKLFKFENNPGSQHPQAQRTAEDEAPGNEKSTDQREERNEDELCSAVRDRMVQDIIEAEGGKKRSVKIPEVLTTEEFEEGPNRKAMQSF